MSAVLLRLLVLLIAFGLMAGAVQASDPGTTSNAAFIDEVEDSAEPALIVVESTLVPPDRTIDALAGNMQLPAYQHSLYVFRPPRAPAFN